MQKITRKVNGILLLNKPLDISSNGALQQVKRLFAAKKAGHTGSLDPKATGMLPICFGEATKFSQFLLESNKSYSVEVKLGVKTTTGDAEGEIVQTREVFPLPDEKINPILQTFLGTQQQIPPMYSAIKIKGKPLYTLARKGIEIPREPRAIHIFQIALTERIDNETFRLLVRCSKGTYVRTLVEDIGEALGVGAHVSQLHRLAVEPYEEDKMLTLPALEAIFEQSGYSGLDSCLLPLETSVQAYPAVKLSSAAAFYIRMGQPVRVPQLPPSGGVRIYTENTEFMGVGDILEDGRIAPRRLIMQGQAVNTCPNPS